MKKLQLLLLSGLSLFLNLPLGRTEELDYDYLKEKLEILEKTIRLQEEEKSRISISGEGRMTVASTEKKLIGNYGKSLRKSVTFKKRLDISLKFRQTNILSTTAKIRISDENPQATENGLEYISSVIPWASGSLDLEKERMRATLGMYEIFFTPLTLMGWDLNDVPRTGCCGASVLTELSSNKLSLNPEPELTFEGFKFSKLLGESIDFITIGALPQSAKENKSYTQYLYGGRIKGFIYHPSSFSFKSVGLTFVRVEDDKNSATSVPYTPVNNQVWGGDFNLPVSKILTFFGEWVNSRMNTNLLLHDAKIKKGNGKIIGLKIASLPKMENNICYIRMEPDYTVLYDALSYTGNREGIRISSTYEELNGKILLTAFYKQLIEIKPTIGDQITTLHTSLSSFHTANLGVFVKVIDNLIFYSGYDYRLTTCKDDNTTFSNEKIKNKQTVATVSFTYNLDSLAQKSFSLRHRFVTYKDEVKHNDDCTTNITLFETSVNF